MPRTYVRLNNYKWLLPLREDSLRVNNELRHKSDNFRVDGEGDRQTLV